MPGKERTGQSIGTIVLVLGPLGLAKLKSFTKLIIKHHETSLVPSLAPLVVRCTLFSVKKGSTPLLSLLPSHAGKSY